jgi:hypothetical protein
MLTVKVMRPDGENVKSLLQTLVPEEQEAEIRKQLKMGKNSRKEFGALIVEFDDSVPRGEFNGRKQGKKGGKR